MQDLNILIGYHLRRASTLLMAALAERLAELGLTATEATILVVLSNAPLSSQSDIGRTLSIKRANMTPLMANLIARGLVKRTASSGRAHSLKLTRKGEGLAIEARTCMFEHDQTYFGRLSDESRQQLISFFSSIWRETPMASAGETDID